ncbi:hypothetical protein LY10_03367 [Planktotalea frisia]|uniref:Cupin domain protein n=1 Tax=Planktotalea frisia TaxID=696762 RepID=A0A1L9NSB8_9RHOB|nr:hypothetical protein [Planktotalea frisia]OJI92159.1 hypothetical protein PFRI_36260 [Planktotalea frisia]PZX22224.1 hypothetical protein LY10_03367 [Planktotalea frisia]
MELHLYEDIIAAGQKVTFSDTVARAIYVTAGTISTDGQDVACDDGLVADGPVTLVAGPEGASLWRWDLSDADQTASSHRVAHKLSGPVSKKLANSDSFLRLDSVAFPPAGTAMLHTHQGPGIRCLREGHVRIDTEGSSTSYGPGGAWFEGGPEPVFLQAVEDIPSRFIRAMVLPKTLLGKSSIHYVNEEDRAKPKSQSYRNFGEIGLAL